MDDETKQKITGKKLAWQLIVIVLICSALLALPFAISALKRPKIIYRPAHACDLLSQDVVSKIVPSSIPPQQAQPTINPETKIATSKCSFSNASLEPRVIALAVQTGIDDTGVARITKDFEAKLAGSKAFKTVKLGNSAFHDPETGQLHIIDNYHWYIISYTVNGSPTADSLKNAELVAKSFLEK